VVAVRRPGGPGGGRAGEAGAAGAWPGGCGGRSAPPRARDARERGRSGGERVAWFNIGVIFGRAVGPGAGPAVGPEGRGGSPGLLMSGAGPAGGWGAAGVFGAG
jgi:hypothetical protein